MQPFVDKKRERARELRQAAPDAERKLWRALRNRGLDGLRFKRQVPIGPWFADFCCNGCKLIVELDGYHHAETKARDERRTAWLEREGYRVIRFWNGDVFTSFDAVLEEIVRVARERHEQLGGRGPSPE
jgi:very-short-patch-repair endonuclease